MAEKEQHSKNEQKTSQHLDKTDDAQQQEQHPNKIAENVTTDNSNQIKYVSEDDRKIYVGGLKEKITEKDLREHFSQFGDIKYIDFKIDSATGRSRGYAFIVFKTIEGMNNALECNNHVINDIKIEPKKAIPRSIKLFVGGLSSNIIEDDVIDYFKRYTHDLIADRPFDKIKNKRKGFCFITIANLDAVTEILRVPRHVIKDKQVDVKVADTRLPHNEMMPGASRSMLRIPSHFMGQGGFQPQLGYPLYAPGYYYGGYGYYSPYTLNYPYNYHYNYHYNYGYPSYVAGSEAGYRSQGNEASAPSGVNGNQIMGGKM